MSSTHKPSLLIRIATLTLAAGSLTALIVQASLSAGCNGSGTTAIPSATPEPPAQQAQPQPQMGTPASAAAAEATHPQPALKPGADYLPATKAAPVFHSGDVAEDKAKVQQKAPAQNANPALKPGADHFPATKSGFVFDPEERPAQQAPAAQQGSQPQGRNR